MGDSYISGEAGRWAGNSIDNVPGSDGTDRACLPAGSLLCKVDESKVYIDGSTDGCHRSDVSELLSARLAVDRRFNIACSGAVAKNLLRGSSGGTGQYGEQPQGDLLGPIARSNDVKLIVVSIGGNDFGFAAIVQACFLAYTTSSGPCEPAQEPKVAAVASTVTSKVGASLADVRAVMTSAGYRDSDYRLVVQTYPSVAPRASDLRYGTDRTAHGCPFYDTDANWARDHAVFEIGTAVKAAARAHGAEVLDLANAFSGHEFCAKSDRQATATDHPDPAHSEWGRIITLTQGMTQELFHPNAYGQMALGACLTGVATGTPGEFSCTGSAGAAPGAESVVRTGQGSVPLPVPSPMKLTIARERLARNERTCVTFLATSARKRVRGVSVTFAGRHGRTGGTGRVGLCAKLSNARHVARAHLAGFRNATVSLTLGRLKVALASYRRAGPGRLCLTFAVTSGRGNVRGALVSFVGVLRHTGVGGRATLCAKPKPGRHSATARSAGYRVARQTIVVHAPATS